VTIEPGDVRRLEALRRAALADDAQVYARAVEHVVRSLDAEGPLSAPPLATQPEQPGILALLVRPSADAAGEALALLWEGAMQLFLRDPTSYAISGIERVSPGPTSPVSKVYEAAVRVLDAPRIPLYVVRSSPGPISSQVALLAPPSVLLAGDCREDTGELRFALGRGLSAALSQNVLRLGLPPSEGRALIGALRAAFGPPEIGRIVNSRAARLAESFWQLVPARAQRRLQQLLGNTQLPEYEELVARAAQSGRRVGMFLAGDFELAVRASLAEVSTGSGPSVADGGSRPIDLRALCEEHPMVADLLRLAVSPEYAQARWQTPEPVSPRGARYSAL
jgi:hypothetical protein